MTRRCFVEGNYVSAFSSSTSDIRDAVSSGYSDERFRVTSYKRLFHCVIAMCNDDVYRADVNTLLILTQLGGGGNRYPITACLFVSLRLLVSSLRRLHARLAALVSDSSASRALGIDCVDYDVATVVTSV